MNEKIFVIPTNITYDSFRKVYVSSKEYEFISQVLSGLRHE